MITISNEHLSVKIAEKGAELQSLIYKGLEYIWQANAEYWAKHSPILFPIVGELKGGKYFFEGKEYKLPRHGFARDRLFEAGVTSMYSVVFTLKSDAESLVVYPFRFIFKVIYRIEETKLFCTYLVENADVRTMYFSVGGHPAFNVPLKNDLQYSDYVLKFNNDNLLKKYVLHSGLTGDDTQEIQLPNNELRLHPALFYEDAIVLKQINSSEVELATHKDIHALKLTFEGFPFFGIWAAKDAPFVCLEPWCGIADNIHHNSQLIDKEGINQLTAGESWQRTWYAEVI